MLVLNGVFLIFLVATMSLSVRTITVSLEIEKKNFPDVACKIKRKTILTLIIISFMIVIIMMMQVVFIWEDELLV